MSHSVLITGASGYLGGSLLAQLSRTELPPHKQIYALARSQEQADAVRQYGAEPLEINLEDDGSVFKAIVDAKISVVYYLVDAVKSHHQVSLIKALGEVKKQTGQDVHFLHTSGAKIFSEHAAMPTDCTISDADPELYDLQKKTKAPFALMAQAVNTNNTIIETAESFGVRSYIFVPCIVYGEGEGFGNRISIQTTAVVKAAKNAGAVYDANPEGATWPVCHVRDNTRLYVDILRSILAGANPPHGKQGYYLASSGSVPWLKLYTAIAQGLAQRKVIGSEVVEKADDAALEKMAEALGCPKQFVAVQLGGVCKLSAVRGASVGWKPEYTPEHIIEAADAEVELILKHLQS